MITPSISVIGLLMLLLAAGGAQGQTAAEVAGIVTFNGAPVPGVTVTATRNEARVSTTTDVQGTYRLRGLDAGTWTITTALAGFAPASIDVIVPPTGPVPALTLTLLPFDQVADRVAAHQHRRRVATNRRAGREVHDRARRERGARATGGAAAGSRHAATAPAAFPGDSSDDAARCRGRVSHQRQREQRWRVAVRTGARVRQQPARRPRALHGRRRPAVQPLGARCAAVSRSPAPARRSRSTTTSRSWPTSAVRCACRACATIPTRSSAISTSRTTPPPCSRRLVPTAAERAGRLLAVARPFGRPVQLIDPATGQPFASQRASCATGSRRRRSRS